MAIRKILGEDPVETGEARAFDDESGNRVTVTVEGLKAAVDLVAPSTYVPAGYELESWDRATNGDGTSTLHINCIRYNAAESFSPERTTFRVDMVEASYELKNHPHLSNERETIDNWLATDPGKRYDSAKQPQWVGADGKAVPITGALAKKFIAAYNAGITTYVLYFPVIEKISIYSNPPGMLRSETKFTGGSPIFSAGIGTYSAPPLTLNGYPNSNYFKSKDSWVEGQDRKWRRTEQWTYTANGSGSEHAWIYGGGNQGGGGQ